VLIVALLGGAHQLGAAGPLPAPRGQLLEQLGGAVLIVVHLGGIGHRGDIRNICIV